MRQSGTRLRFVFTFTEASLGRRRGFGTFWAAITVSSLGDGMRFAALPLLAATLSTDPRAVSAVTLAEQLPWLGVGLAAGAIADRVDRRRLIWTVDTARAALAGALTLAALSGHATIPLLCVTGFLLSCGPALYNGAFPGVLTALVDPAGLPAANARVQAGALVTDTLLGTPLGAAAFTLAVALPFGVDTASFAVAALLVASLPGRYRSTREQPTTLRQDVAEGVRWLARHRMLRLLCLLVGVGNIVLYFLIAVLVLYARQVLHLGPTGFGLLVAAFAVGGVAGAVTAPRLAAALGTGRTLQLAWAGSAAAVAGVALARSGLVAGLCIALYGLATSLWDVTTVSLRQALV